MDSIVNASWLNDNLSSVIVMDVRWSLNGSARSDYAEAHVPGAHFVDLDADLAEPPASGLPGRHPLPEPATFAAMLARVGYVRGQPVVAYDADHGGFAARVWWLMGYFGLGSAAVLDGGLAAWTQAGLALEATTPTGPASPLLTLTPDRSRVVDADRVDACRHDANVLIVDSRSAARYRGEHEPIDPRAGHVPGAVSGPFADNLDDGRFKSAEALRERFDALGALDKEVVFYCGSGVTACHNVLALERAGRASVLYEGSWSDWSSDANRPIETGPSA